VKHLRPLADGSPLFVKEVTATHPSSVSLIQAPRILVNFRPEALVNDVVQRNT
jgi:hypothetical protein